MNFGISGKLQTLLSRLTATRAGYLDAAISTRATAADVTGISPIESIQTGYLSGNVVSNGTGEDAHYCDVTISAVDITKCVILDDDLSYAGSANNADILNGADTERGFNAHGRLTSSTNMRVSSTSAVNGFLMYGRYTIIEFK